MIYLPYYCENEDCGVLIYQVPENAEANCPGCGLFGRKKGHQY